MRKESSTVQKCKRQMATLGFDSQLAYHRVKLILKIYRDVVWVLSERVEELHEYAWELGDQDADTGLIYLQSFAPDMDLQEFEERVCCVMENRMLVDVIDPAPSPFKTNMAALYLSSLKGGTLDPRSPPLSHDSIDFSRIVSKPHGFACTGLPPSFYSARRLYDLKSPMEAEDLAHPKLVGDLDFHNIIYATMIARYGRRSWMRVRRHQNGLCAESGTEQRSAPGIWAD